MSDVKEPEAEPIRLNTLADNPGATKPRKRIGRGIGSGKGKTGGRGQKGQKSRSGVAIKGFEGGQMPLYQRLPKRGFNKPNRARFAEVTLARLQTAVDAGKLDAKKPITEDALVSAGVVRRKWDGVSLIGGGELKAALTLTVTRASASAAEAVAQAGGSITYVERFARVTVGQIQKAATAGDLDAGKPIDAEVLVAAKVIKRALTGVHLVAQGRINAKVNVTVAKADEAAVKAVEAAGGAVSIAPVEGAAASS